MLGLRSPEDFTIIREGKGEIIDGIPQKEDPSQLRGSGVFTPADGKTMRRVDENTVTSEVLQLFTDDEVRSASIANDHVADKIIVPSRNATYLIQDVADWRAQGGSIDAVCVRIGQ